MANQYIYNLSDTWTDSGTAYDAIKINVTNTGSAASSKLLNLQVDSAVKFGIDASGAVNMAGALSGVVGLTMSGALTGATNITGSGTVTADRLTVTKTAANAPAISSTGYSLTGSDASSLVDLAGAWDTSGNPSAIKLNLAVNNSGATSRLLDLQIGGVTYAHVTKEGYFVSIGNGNNFGKYLLGPTGAGRASIEGGLSVGSEAGMQFLWNNTRMAQFLGTSFVLKGDWSLAWASGSPGFTSADTFLIRDGAANVIAQRNGTSTQAFRVYRTWADTSNYEALELAHATYSSAQYSILRTITAGTGADNINLVLSPSGTGALTALLPDGGNTNGNARGARAVDLQLETNLNTRVASGSNSVLIGGRRNTASGTESGVFAGTENTSSNAQSGVFAGSGNLASGSGAVVLGGGSSTASAIYSSAIGFQSLANKHAQFAHSAGAFAATGDAQRSLVLMRRATADANATELFLDGSSARLTVPTNTAWHADVRIIGRQAGGTNHAIYHRKCCIQNTAGTTALVGTVQTIGTDIETDSNWAVAVTADDTNDALKIEVTGASGVNVRWVAEVQLVEVGYA